MSDGHQLRIHDLDIELRVLRFVGVEALNQHFAFDVDVSVARADMGSLQHGVLGREMTLTMRVAPIERGAP